VEAIGTVWSILDRTPLGRQEEWEDIPEDRPQGPKFDWWRFHDRYENTREPAKRAPRFRRWCPVLVDTRAGRQG
jgi:Bacterial protein of unknown function (DUF899)